jgi:hypothetical protein
MYGNAAKHTLLLWGCSFKCCTAAENEEGPYLGVILRIRLTKSRGVQHTLSCVYIIIRHIWPLISFPIGASASLPCFELASAIWLLIFFPIGESANFPRFELASANLPRFELASANLHRFELAFAYFPRFELASANLARFKLASANMTRFELVSAVLNFSSLY